MQVRTLDYLLAFDDSCLSPLVTLPEMLSAPQFSGYLHYRANSAATNFTLRSTLE